MGKINWRDVLNPWAKIARLEAALEYERALSDDYRERAYEAERNAIGAAVEYFERRNRHMLDHNRAMAQHTVTLAELQPRPIILTREMRDALGDLS
jgi:hypothetical protein